MPRSDSLWISVAELECMKDCKDYILGGMLLDDHGKPLNFRWHQTQPGDGKRTCQFQCSSHVKCGFLAKGVRVAGAFWVQVLADVEHSPEKTLMKRSNSCMTCAQAEELKQMVNAGAKPAAIQSSLTVRELEKCKKGKGKVAKRANGGLAGKSQCPDPLEHQHQVNICRIYLQYTCNIPTIYYKNVPNIPSNIPAIYLDFDTIHT
jgi:hypothetical protein